MPFAVCSSLCCWGLLLREQSRHPCRGNCTERESVHFTICASTHREMSRPPEASTVHATQKLERTLNVRMVKRLLCNVTNRMLASSGTLCDPAAALQHLPS